MKTKKILAISILIIFACNILAAEEQGIDKKLNLSRTKIAGATVYYEKEMEETLPTFERLYKEYSEQLQNQNKFVAQKLNIIKDINEIIGPTELNLNIQFENTTKTLNRLFEMSRTVYLVKKETVKDYLRKGGKLPYMSYDKQTDTVNMYFGIIGQSENQDTNFTNYFSGKDEPSLFIPIDNTDKLEKNVRDYLEIIKGSFRSGAVLHETIELAILNKYKPEDQYWRWFTDGFANAIAIELLKKYDSIETAKNFAQAYDVNDCKEFKSDINLRYWLPVIFCIKTPLEYEENLNMARYAYATYEAQQLIEKNGIECIEKILDNLRQKKPRNCGNLLAAIKEATGADMEQRLRQYQTFDGEGKGIAKYRAFYNKASEKDNYEQAIINLLHLLELEDNQLSARSLQMRKIISLLLFKLGDEKAGDEAMLNFLEILKENKLEDAYDSFSTAFVIYALECNNPKKAQKIAEEILKKNPDDSFALTVKMKLLAESNNIEEARKIARKILNLDDDPSSPDYQAATELLARDPNQKKQDKPR